MKITDTKTISKVIWPPFHNSYPGKDLQRALWTDPPASRQMPGVPRYLTHTLTLKITFSIALILTLTLNQIMTLTLTLVLTPTLSLSHNPQVPEPHGKDQDQEGL